MLTIVLQPNGPSTHWYGPSFDHGRIYSAETWLTSNRSPLAAFRVCKSHLALKTEIIFYASRLLLSILRTIQEAHNSMLVLTLLLQTATELTTS